MTDMYVAAMNENGGIYHYKADESFNLKLVKKYDIEMPMYIIRRGNTMHIITQNSPQNDGNGGYLTAKIADDGSLYDISVKVSSEGKSVCHLYADESAAYCVNYSSGSICKIGEKLVTHTGNTGPHKTRQDMPHTHFVNASPDGKYILVCDLGLDKIMVYDKGLKFLSSANVPAGHGARTLEYSKDGKTVYCANELTGTVTVFSYNDGTLIPKGTYASIPEEYRSTNTAAAIRLSDDEKYLYISNRGHDSIAIFEVNTDKSLQLKSIVPCGGKHPRDFNIYGKYLVCANMHSDTLTVFERVNDTLIQRSEYKTEGGPLCVMF